MHVGSNPYQFYSALNRYASERCDYQFWIAVCIFILGCVCCDVQVERSKALLTSLGDEKERWETGSQTFKSQMSTISGDVLLTSAFMAYGGEG